MPSNKKILLDICEHLDHNFKDKYIKHTLVVPDNAVKVGLTFTYNNDFSETNPKKAVMFISFHDPNGFKGHRMNPGGVGEVNLDLWTTPDASSEGALPGEIIPGKWMIQIDIRALTGQTDYHLIVYIEESDEKPSAVEYSYPADHVVNSEKGWYKGELHAHSTESDGQLPVHEVIEAAKNYGLDYISLTDHTTNSQWHKLAKLQNSKLAIIRSLEITSHVGHANLHGIHDWVNVYINQPGWSVNQAAEETHQQGGLFCINHAFSGVLSWRDQTLDWNLVDMEEIYHNLEGANNSYQLALWDQHLNDGYRIVGVGGIDSHRPYEGIHELGQVVTYVYADELSEKGIIDGLKRGQVYISRGPKFEFSAKNGNGTEAKMWEVLPNDGKVSFEISYQWNSPLNIFIIKNGYIFEVIRSEPSAKDWTSLTFSDPDPLPGSYYRVELHDAVVNLPYTGIIWRDYTTMRILSNPIWVEGNSKENQEN